MNIDLLKHTKEIFHAILEITNNPLLMTGIFLVSGACLFAPYPANTEHIFFNLVQKYIDIIFAFFIISLIAIIVMIIKYFIVILMIRHYFSNITTNERIILEKYIAQNEHVIYLPSSDPAVMSLYNHRIIAPESIGGIIPGRFDIDEGDLRPFRINSLIFKKIKKKQRT